MPVTLPTLEEHNALAARVAKLEGAPPVVPVVTASPPALTLLGAFRVDPFYDAVDEMNYAGEALAYHLGRDSLFITGHRGGLAELSLAGKTPVLSTRLADLPMLARRQGWADVVSRLPVRITNYDALLPGGLMVSGGKLAVSQYVYYSTALDQTELSHFVVDDPANLAGSTVRGLFRAGGRSAAGYMTEVPAGWQTSLGCTHTTGLSNKQRNGMCSSGPAAFGINLNQLGVLDPLPVAPLLYYPNDHQLGPYTGTVSPIQNGTTMQGGAAFVGDWLLFFGSSGQGLDGYGVEGTLNDYVNTGTGPKTQDGVYLPQVWAVPVSDLLAVRNGTKQPWEIVPTFWTLDLPIKTPAYKIGGVAYDRAGNRLFVVLREADNLIDPANARLPVIFVFKVGA